MISLKVTFDGDEPLNINVSESCVVNCFLDAIMNTANINLHTSSDNKSIFKSIAIQLYNKNLTSVELYHNGILVDILEGDSELAISWNLCIGEIEGLQETLVFSKKLIK